MRDYLSFNQERWNRMAKKGIRFAVPLDHETIEKARQKSLSVSLTIGDPVPLTWFEQAPGKRLLGLACGGGQQGPLFAAKGYDTTIMDYSEVQLASDRMVADREGLHIKTVQADMTKPFPFEDEAFDIIFCPVSNVYIEELTNMWQECCRVLRKKGLLMVGYMNPWVYMFDPEDVWDQPDRELTLKYPLPYNPRLLELEGKITIDPEYGYEFSHTWEAQIRGQLKAGFAMLDFYESRDENNRLSAFGSDYLANLCVRL